jgi:soluble lytic murein transglycosylase-like protein
VNPTRESVETLIRVLCAAEQIPSASTIRQCEAESSFRQFDGANRVVKSPCGALGLFQLMPATAAELGVDPTRWHENVFGGVKYMGQLTRQFGSHKLALAAYNCGPGRLRRIMGEHRDNWEQELPSETRAYLKRILNA